ncbi:unnamed protein product [Linum trigynum]|uniref:Neprosin PEP catalytic domain-containing protein n=2 Tax=Linum trigynum TaxID=586398 RepID=A0AAV2CVX8_9ROSI
MKAAKDHKIMSFNSLLVILSLSSLLPAFGVNGASTNGLFLDPNSILKTIKSEGGEVIDCVDIYKQPAFRHPRLANHSLQMKPSSYPIGIKPKGPLQSDNSSVVSFQRWRKNGEYCPEGTIPILRSSEENFRRKKGHPLGSSTNSLTPAGDVAEFAVVFLPGSNFHGAIGEISVWNPKTLKNELSAAQFWLTDGGGSSIDSVEAGWRVTDLTNYPSLFVYYTPDGYKTGLQPSSTYGGAQYLLQLTIHRDDQNGNWCFNLNGEDVGYWPTNLFNGGLRGTASLLECGGEIVNSNPRGFHTSTEMGSGHFPGEGYGKAAWFRNLKYITDGGRVKDAKDITGQATRPACYDIQVQKWEQDMGIHFYYGGPGFSPACLH